MFRRKYRSSRKTPASMRSRRLRLVAVISRTSERPVTPSTPIVWNLSGLRKSQEDGLHPQAHLAEFVEEQRAAISLADKSGFVTIRAGEAAPRVTEQLRFKQRFRNTAAIDGNKSSRRSRSCVRGSVAQRLPSLSPSPPARVPWRQFEPRPRSLAGAR